MEPRLSIVTLGVADLPRAIRFYRDGLRFQTNAKDDDDIAHFATTGTLLGLYPLKKLAEDISPGVRLSAGGFAGITLAHTVRKKAEVAEVLAFAKKAGGTIVKEAQDAFWGGYAGYFADLDGYYWEVAWNPHSRFDDAGNLLI